MLRGLHSNIRVLLLTCFFLSLSLGPVQPYLSEYVYSITGSATLVGLIMSLRSVICILALIIGGYIGDALGRRWPIGAGTMLLGAARLIYALAQNAQDLFVAAICDGASAFYFPSFNAMIMDLTTRDRLVSIFILSFVTDHLPHALMPIPGGILRDTYGILGLRLVFGLGGAAGIIIGLVRIRLLSETISGSRGLDLRLLWAAYRGMPESFLRMRPVVQRIILLRGLCLVTAISMFQYFAILYAIRYTQVTSFTEWGLITALASLSLLLPLPLGKYIKQRRMAAAYASLIFICGLAVMAFTIPEKITFMTSMILLNASGAITYAIERSVTAMEIEKDMRARAETLLNLSFYLGDALGSYIGGLAYSWHPPNVFLLASALLMAGSLIGFIILKTTR